MADVGYIRVSSADQNTDRQLADFHLDKVFIDKISGATTDRPKLRECLEYVRDGDTLHVHSMDRLARNLADLQRLVEDLTERGVKVRFRKEGLEFDGTENPMSKLLLQMMGAVAEFERSMIKERQAEGIKKALARGVRFGRKPKLSDATKREIIALVDSGQEKKAVAEKYMISRTTVYKILEDWQSGKITGPVECQTELSI
ncbi:MAG: recombinase family protein [Desulfobacter sp.]|nr:MAG: recombinase family protein [Desulfobacter sp.]